MTGYHLEIPKCVPMHNQKSHGKSSCKSSGLQQINAAALFSQNWIHNPSFLREVDVGSDHCDIPLSVVCFVCLEEFFDISQKLNEPHGQVLASTQSDASIT
ncbi:unnamed protein product [Soboliphyme baturini]|uniref:Ovule protein n=1 Tax=Soboliphyme baturini TaxID=241478 RepID=A0A183IJ97_9BILA|nr:unnamed protein product [Soboliphyme baturini]